ncbi:MAG: hypothetical protein EXX96DRAFT_518803 [Benjaminiella poitrasii]|nr:MAG: hypothetical protein EXX96DRAFT_518803 [Benjaminiella poitrasii]
MFLFANVWPTLLSCYFLISITEAQASPSNPFIWQILAEYDLAQSNKTKYYIPESSSKVYSPEFQTVYEYKDLFGYNERLVMNFGDGCPNTTIDDIEALNGNWATSPSMMSQPSIALAQRSGRCQRWSEKIATIQSLSQTYGLQITGVVIYDHISYNDTILIQEDTNNMAYPSWQTTQQPPAERSIQHMTDENDIDVGTTFVAVYYVPRRYIEQLDQTLPTSTNGTWQSYRQLTFSLGENHFPSSSDPSATIPKTASDSSDNWDEERNRRNYIIYSVTAASIVIVVFVITRWCRAMRRPVSVQDNLLLTDLPPSDVIPFEKLGELCPIVKYEDVSMLNTTCAICLDDFMADFYVRVLPCHHGYCTACIDVWLTKKSCVCPICKYNCKNALEDETAKSVTDEVPEVVVDPRPSPRE